MREFQIGDRVRLTRDVDRFPDGIAKTGETGTVVEIPYNGRFHLLAVQLDTKHEWLNEWNNELHWYDHLLGDPKDDLTLIALDN